MSYIFIIDTEQYAGNFEREMCAFMTGQVGECGVGEAQAAKFEALTGYDEETNPFSDIIRCEPDEHGCHRPAAVWETPEWSNDGDGIYWRGPGKYPAYLSVALFFEEQPTEELVALMMQQARTFAARSEERITITGCRLLRRTTTIEELALPDKAAKAAEETTDA